MCPRLIVNKITKYSNIQILRTTPFNNQGNTGANNQLRVSQDSKKPESLFKKFFTGQELLTTLTVLSTVVGVLVGLILRQIYPGKEWTKRELMYVAFLGDLFLRMLKVLIIPLLVCSIISAIGSLDLSLSKRIGGQSVFYYVLTTTLAVFQGIFWVLLIRPGNFGSKQKLDQKNETKTLTIDTLLDLVRNLFPENIVGACIQQDKTMLIEPTNGSLAGPKTSWEYKMVLDPGTNVLGLVAFSIALGIALARLGPKAKGFMDMIDSLGEAIMMMTKAVIWLSPFGVCFLVIKNIIEMKSFSDLVGQMGLYFITVLIGLIVHGFLTVPSLYLLCLRKFPFKFIKNMGPAIVTAFGTGSSSASLPVSMHCLEGANRIDQRVSRFVMPIGATINMDGTALYEAVAAIYISQIKQIPLSIGQILAVSFTATMASIGAAGIPQAGLVTLVMVLDTVGLPSEDIGYILAVDWLLDRCRTVVNVLGDAIGAGIVARYARKELQRLDEIEHAKKLEAQHNDETTWHNTPM